MHPDKYQVLHLAAFVSQSCMASIEQCLLWFARSALGGAIKPFPVSQYMAIKRSSPLGEKKLLLFIIILSPLLISCSKMSDMFLL